MLQQKFVGYKMASRNYKKYMKKEVKKDFSALKLFFLIFFGMLLFFIVVIKTYFPSVDVSIGDYNHSTEPEIPEVVEQNIDDRLAQIQNEDLGTDFSSLMKKAEDIQVETNKKVLSKSLEIKKEELKNEQVEVKNSEEVTQEPIYKVFIGSYSSEEQAKVAKDIIVESGINLNPIVKCVGANNYTLQVGIFKNKASAETLLYTIKQNHLPGRIITDF